MKITSVELSSFRNYKRASVKFTDGLNVLYGENGSGKTNMLESVYFASVFSSPRAVKDKEMVLIGAPAAVVKVVVERKYRKHTIVIQIDAQGKKKVLVDGVPVSRAAELLGILGVVLFSPDEMKLVKESPVERRRFLDIGLSQQQKAYFVALSRYNHTLKQKNNLLKEYKTASNVDDMLDVWDAVLAKEGATIIARRKEYIATLNDSARKFHFILSGNKETLTLSYESGAKTDCEDAELEQNLLAALRSSRDKDKELGFSTVGPHRDDIKIEINGKDARKFASQGQQRTTALAMKIGQVVIYKDEIGEPPVLLLDDVLSELDEGRQHILLDLVKGFQTILTCTEYKLSNSATLYEVADGNIKQKN
ncbi:MAG: DNA replication/repair protein RecF [Clostridia bacterium]|nr:DNA replication/repair protein RecF [Clostridia bacterium]